MNNGVRRYVSQDEVDTKLDTASYNPISNKTVAVEIRDVAREIQNVRTNIEDCEETLGLISVSEELLYTRDFRTDIFWDGDTTNKTVILDSYYKISDTRLSLLDLMRGECYISGLSEGEAYSNYELTIDNAIFITDDENNIGIVLDDMEEPILLSINEMISPEEFGLESVIAPGLYAFKNGDTYVKQITYTPVKIDQNLIPNKINQSSNIVNNSFYLSGTTDTLTWDDAYLSSKNSDNVVQWGQQLGFYNYHLITEEVPDKDKLIVENIEVKVFNNVNNSYGYYSDIELTWGENNNYVLITGKTPWSGTILNSSVLIVYEPFVLTGTQSYEQASFDKKGIYFPAPLGVSNEIVSLNDKVVSLTIKNSNAFSLYKIKSDCIDISNIEAESIILKSPNGTRFSITIGDDGVLSATEITE